MPCCDAANIGERKTWTQSEFCTWQNSVRGQEPPKCIYSVPVQETAKHRAKFGWPPLSDVTAINEANTRNTLKFAGVPQTRQPMSAANGPKFTIFWGHAQEILMFNRFFSDCQCLSCEDTGRQSCAMMPRWRLFASCISSEPRAAHFRPAF